MTSAAILDFGFIAISRLPFIRFWPHFVCWCRFWLRPRKFIQNLNFSKFKMADNWLDMVINCKKSFCLRIGPRYDTQCADIISLSGQLIPWATEIRQSPWPGAQQWSFPTTVEDKHVPALPLSTHSAVEMLHDSALYKFMIEIDIDIDILEFILLVLDCSNVR